MTKLRIACLHGYTSNAFIFSRRCGAIRKACKDVAEFHFINGPHLVQPISGLGGLDGPSEREVVDETTPLEEQPRAWWRAQDDRTYSGWDETVEFLNAQMAETGPWDAIMGFSQGACMTGLLAAAFEKPDRVPGLRLHRDQTPLKFAIAISGFRSREPRHEALFEEKIRTPMLCVLGKEDYIVEADRSQTLTDACANVRVEWHEGGHATPSQAPWRNFFRDYIAAFAEPSAGLDWRTLAGPSDRPKGSPSSAIASANSSGASTPVLGANSSSHRRPGKSLADAEHEEEQERLAALVGSKPTL
ncbi:FSH1-domain-containing protein [Tilletiaria anomala UBC 951]|uniref:FSH1-domain-containing protein n=1 Tax=Tilletiaria anomala (strain ATCC 24038 / CBS 436.72 / UBC 951) TaxID=1037660 RepID=A0A066W484_TILAU|nr:FSH1-domain-containing protein [Tilletiaria anomala UBC 951]KDN45605.1 FSH1-domain-containing protein [Tilletiaria anomala UBC 951]